jgi:HEAT repeat protein
MKARRIALVASVALIGGVFLVILLRSPHVDVDADLRDPNPAVRAAAVRRLTVDTDRDRLLSSLKDDNSDVRQLSAMALGERPAAASSTAALIEALKDRHAGVRRTAGESLGALWPATEKALTDGLTDSNPRVRAGAAYALGWASNPREGRAITTVQAEPLRPLLRNLANDEDSEVRQNATHALDLVR